MYEKVASVTVHAGIVAAALWATGAHPAQPNRPPLVIDLPIADPAGPVRGPIGSPVVPFPSIPSIPDVSGPVVTSPFSDFPIVVSAPGTPRGGAITIVDTGVFTPLTVDEAPELLSAPPPVYPSLLRLAGISGKVLVEAVVDTAGRVEPNSARVVDATDPAFGASALASVRRALFRPARMYGRAVRVLVRLPVVFALRP